LTTREVLGWGGDPKPRAQKRPAKLLIIELSAKGMKMKAKEFKKKGI